ncbi:hypothetical protein K9F62_20455 [Desulfovibrio sp. JY]|nr:hypothetical protein K9F62_20455 [Desulfovibrio sp. JY]
MNSLSIGSPSKDTTSESLSTMLASARPSLTDALENQSSKAVTDTYSINESLYAALSNATYTNLGLLNNIASSSATTGPSRYVFATLQSFDIAQQLQASQSNNIMSLLDQFGGISVSGTYYPNPEAQSESYIKAVLKRKGNKQIREDQAEQAQKEKEDAEEKARQAETDGTSGSETASDAAGSDETTQDAAASKTEAASPDASPANAAPPETSGPTPTTGQPAGTENPPEQTVPASTADAADPPIQPLSETTAAGMRAASLPGYAPVDRLV